MKLTQTKCAKTKMLSHIEGQKCLSVSVWVLEKKMFTMQAIIGITEEVLDSVKKKEAVLCVLSKTFHSIDREISVNKLEKYGFREVTQQLI